MGVPIDSAKAQLVGLLLEMMAFGAYVIIFIAHMKIVYRRRTLTWTFGYQLATCLTLAILIIIHMGVDFKRALDAFATQTEYTTDSGVTYTGISPQDFFGQYNTGQNRLLTVIYCTITLVADLFIVYRVYVVWSFSYYVAAFPFCAFLVSLGVTIWCNMTFYDLIPGVLYFSQTQIGPATLAFYSATLALNTICTSLIAFRVLWLGRRRSSYVLDQTEKRDPVSVFLYLVVESAAIYSALLWVLIITDVTGSQAMFAVLNLMPPIIGIIFSAIIVRSAPSYQPQESRAATTLPTFQSPHPQSDSHDIEGVTIRLETVSHTDDLGGNHTPPSSRGCGKTLSERARAAKAREQEEDGECDDSISKSSLSIR